MRKWLPGILIGCAALPASAQQAPILTVEKIMQDARWMGTSPDHVFWGTDNKTVYFTWNPDKALNDSLYSTPFNQASPVKTAPLARARLTALRRGQYNQARTAITYSLDGDIYLLDLKTGKDTRITHTGSYEYDPHFSFEDKRIVYTADDNLYAWTIADGSTAQLTDFTKGEPPKAKPLNHQEKWLEAQQQTLFDIIKEKKEMREAAKAYTQSVKTDTLKTLYTGDQEVEETRISPDGRYVVYQLRKPATGAQSTKVPNFVTASGFTTDIPSRTKVGEPLSAYSSFIYDRVKDTVLPVITSQLPGIHDLPDYAKDYAHYDTTQRGVVVHGPYWSPKGTYALVDIFSQDFKDRWLGIVDMQTGAIRTIDRQRDEAWVAGPGIDDPEEYGDATLGWLDEHTCWYMSQASGYAHVYKTDVTTGRQTALTQGSFEVQEATLSHDKKYFYLLTNAVHPGEKQWYRMPATGGQPQRITTMTGAHEVSISPDGKWIAYRYSYTNKPWELYVQENVPGSKPLQLTFKAASDEFKAYPWRDVPVTTFTARDGATVYARIFKPDPAKKNGAAVIFVHGAGYLQNAHRWWSAYFREYMFNNLLTDQGYTVMDIDYRGSAGYGSKWRTGIYRYMGGKDLTDQVDGAKLLVDKYGVDARRIGLYGGSYGGFITLMGLFTQPEVFR
ncbi:MAG TPA: DPP IV N-terminal domain-containing protein, partial [Chitinophaga sp.]